MDDYFSKSGKRTNRFSDLAGGVLGGRFEGEKLGKKNILIAIILILSMGLFFSVLFEKKVYARQDKKIVEISSEIVDPLNKIGKGTVSGRPLEAKDICKKEDGERVSVADEKDRKEKEREDRIKNMVAGHPIEEMARIISRRDEKTAAFLVAIARKESSWGLHAPHSGERDCFNYWGYKGSYKLVKGYSCFDSPEQAVAIVGDKIKSLVDQKIDTPERFVVWKCGSSCVGHDPAGVKKWISDVRVIFYKLQT